MEFEEQNDVQFQVLETYSEETGILRVRTVKRNGMRQTPPSGDAAYAVFDEFGRPQLLVWYENDVESRLDGPSLVRLDPSSGVHIMEAYSIDGKPRPSLQGPHVVYRDPSSGRILEEYTADEWEKKWSEEDDPKMPPPSPNI